VLPFSGRTTLVGLLALGLISLLGLVPDPFGEGRLVEPAPELDRITLRTELFRRRASGEQDVAVVDLDVQDEGGAPAGPAETDTDVLAPRDPRLALLRDRLAGLAATLDAGGVALERPCLRRDETGACARRALDRFLDRLVATALGEAAEPVRWMQYGDSLTNWAWFTGELRRRLQAQFGDAGFGLAYLANPSPAPTLERREGVRIAHGGFDTRFVLWEDDPAFGPAGVAFHAGPGAWFRARTVDGGAPWGRVGLYLADPDGGAGLRLEAEAGARPVSLEVPPGRSVFRWLSLDAPSATVRLADFSTDTTWQGVVLETGGPGVVVDNVGLVRGRLTFLERIQQWEGQLAGRPPDVLVFFYGAVSGHDHDPAWHRAPPPEAWVSELEAAHEAVLGRARAALPDRDCLVLGHLTRGIQVDGELVEAPSVAPTVAVQRAAARAHGCAFWDARALLGPDGPAASSCADRGDWRV
jgi:hypothetical protein